MVSSFTKVGIPFNVITKDKLFNRMRKYKFLSLVAVILCLLTLALPFRSNAAQTLQIVGPNGQPEPLSSVSSGQGTNTGTCDGSKYTSATPLSNNVIVCNYIKPAIEFLSAGVGIIAITMIIIGAIQYISSDGSAQAISAAKKKIINALLALVAFALIYAFLNFIIPGGIIPI